MISSFLAAGKLHKLAARSIHKAHKLAADAVPYVEQGAELAAAQLDRLQLLEQHAVVQPASQQLQHLLHAAALTLLSQQQVCCTRVS